MKKLNEENACEAFIVIINSLTGLQYVKNESPDELNRHTPDVDFVLASDTCLCDKIAVEHTILESFEGQIGYVNKSYEIVDSINSTCRNRIPADRYYFLAIPPSLLLAISGRNRKQFVNYISLWIAESTQKLGIGSQVEFAYEGYKILLMCRGSNPQLNGNVWRMPLQPENHEVKQAQRLYRAIKNKLPKLFKYKLRGYKTALLLEDIAGIPVNFEQQSRGMCFGQRIMVRIIVDYIIVFASNNERMVVGNVWKEKSAWHSIIPYDKRFNLGK